MIQALTPRVLTLKSNNKRPMLIFFLFNHFLIHQDNETKQFIAELSLSITKSCLLKCITMQILLSIKLQCDDFNQGHLRTFSQSETTPLTKNWACRPHRVLYFDWLVLILNFSPFRMAYFQREPIRDQMNLVFLRVASLKVKV